MTKEILIQYADLQEEVKEIRDKIDKLDSEIIKIERELESIVDEGTVRDNVKGGVGGLQNFNIEGFPYPEYDKKRSQLLTKKIFLNQQKSTLAVFEYDLLNKTNEVQDFIVSIDDSRMRRIITARFIDRMSWNKVADRIGGGNTEDSVRMAFERFMKET